MAAEFLTSIDSALSQAFAEPLARQWNRSAILLNRLQAKGTTGVGGGKNVAFDLEFTGNQALTVAEGSDVAASEFASDVNLPAILPWAHYRSAFQISETEIDAASSSIGTPTALQDLFGDRIMGAGAQIARKIENDILNGTGVDVNGNPTIIGIFGGALVNSGSYAGVNTTSWTEWQSNVLSNGGVSRSLTVDLLDQADAQIFTASSEQWDVIVTTAGVSRKYGGFFTGSGTGAPSYPFARQDTNATGFQTGVQGSVAFDGQIPQFYRGQQVLRDAVAPIGNLALLNTNHIKIKYLQRKQTPQDAVFSNMMSANGATGVGYPSGYTQATAIPLRIAMLAKTGESVKVMVSVAIQMLVDRPNSCAVVQSILEN
jgi:hypothetical protein